jgi:hypothetical protein
VAAGALRPAVLRWVYLAWMGAGLILGTIVSTLILILFFYLVLTPYGWLLRACGKDFLGKRRGPPTDSYWTARAGPQRDATRYERQF